ncbi:co-chaperone YbbN [Pasteurellaceae bacterium HPA106]|uniref:co-chaperone YbbN n=1 Tax=Spirabiliibacterium pneumoniae TaxID=221400 RepID=UPI001AAD7CD3|nr:co-chaperone YbbN [Spirabiliibacterium pneumoniae]MBE2895615.1 co-chaperone YbbN [Spirabiliibacterium pneumoniae]
MQNQPAVIELTQHNFNDVLQGAAQQPMVVTFFSPSSPQSLEFTALLTRIAEQHNGAFLLLTVNCDSEAMIAQQFQVQSVPTTYLFKEGAPFDAFPGVLSEDELKVRLSALLPKEEELKFNLALDYLQAEDYNNALPLLKEAWALSDQKNSDIALLYAETYIAMKNADSAQQILDQIPLQDRDSRWQGLQAQIELMNEAANTPEIQQLQEDFKKSPRPDIALKLALQLHQAGKNEEALKLLLSFLRQDLNIENGDLKKEYLAILQALGTDPLANQYRRFIYSLLY